MINQSAQAEIFNPSAQAEIFNDMKYISLIYWGIAEVGRGFVV